MPVRKEEVPVVIAGLPPLNMSDLPSYVSWPEKYPFFLAMELNQFSNLDKADWICANSFEALESEVRTSDLPCSHFKGLIK